MENNFNSRNRRQFLKYMVSGTAGAIALGWLLPKSSFSHRVRESANPCTANPNSAACQDYRRGVRAVDGSGNHLHANEVLAGAVAGRPVMVRGLSRPTYLAIVQGPKIAEYGINPVCPHHQCTVEWKADRNRFVCPCHGALFDGQGKFVSGPTRRNLPLITVSVTEEQILLIDRQPATDPR